MRTFIVAASLSLLACPALAQENPCPGGEAKKEFVVPFNAANEAMTLRDYSGALNHTAAARAFAISPLQLSALNQIEIAALYQLDLAGAKQRMTAALNEDVCLSKEVREVYTKTLAQ